VSGPTGTGTTDHATAADNDISDDGKAAANDNPPAAARLVVPAPDFTLPDHHGAEVTLSKVHPDHPVMLVFYPFAFTSICGSELRELQDAMQTFATRDVSLFAISCDPMYSLRIYAERENFTFPLLSDFWPHGEAARAYGVFDESRGCAVRGSFLIGKDGTILWSVVNPTSQARPLAAYEDALALLP
jgi:peroxiredoxin